MRLSRHRQYSAFGMNMTPMIDVVFLLIIFFMTVSQITRVSEQPVDLPQVAATRGTSRPAPVTVNITREGELVMAGQPMTLAHALLVISEQMNGEVGSAADLQVRIRCDRRCKSRFVNRLCQELVELGITAVRISVLESN